MSFRLVSKSVTLNDLERRNGVILSYFSEFGYIPGVLRKSSRSICHLLMSSCCTLVQQLTRKHHSITPTLRHVLVISFATFQLSVTQLFTSWLSLVYLRFISKLQPC